MKLNKITSHKLNPLIIDSRAARNAGSVFETEGVFYRPSQSNIQGIYGKNLNINEIQKININDYQKKKSVEPNFRKNLHSIHHLSQIKDYFIFDTAHKLKF